MRRGARDRHRRRADRLHPLRLQPGGDQDARGIPNGRGWLEDGNDSSRIGPADAALLGRREAIPEKRLLPDHARGVGTRDFAKQAEAALAPVPGHCIHHVDPGFQVTRGERGVEGRRIQARKGPLALRLQRGQTVEDGGANRGLRVSEMILQSRNRVQSARLDERGQNPRDHARVNVSKHGDQQRGRPLAQPVGEGACDIHNPGYDFNDEVIPLGAGYLAALIEESLPLK